MREFGRRSRLAVLPLSGRLVYTIFLVFTLVGLGVSAWLGETSVGLALERFDDYYAGITSGVQGPTSAAAGQTGPNESNGGEAGPVFELPEEALQPARPEPKSFRSTLEVTHFHLFTMPIHWLVLAHLFALGAARERWKVLWIGGSALGVASHLVAPWVARAGGGAAKAFYATSGALLLVSFGWMAIAALWEMWQPQPKPAKTEVD